MEIFTNKFSIILNEDKSEAVMNFYQIAPSWTEKGSSGEGEIVQEILPVASLVMTGQCAQNFSKSLQTLLNQDQEG
nr:hypothetical protein [uncultured Oscillibacter sp.]